MKQLNKKIAIMHRLRGGHEWETERNKSGQFTGKEICVCGEKRNRDVWSAYTQNWGSTSAITVSSGLPSYSGVQGNVFSEAMFDKITNQVFSSPSKPDYIVASPKQISSYESQLVQPGNYISIDKTSS